MTPTPRSSQSHGAARDPHTTPHTSAGDERYQTLISSAFAIIAERGMEGLRLRDVAARVGIHHATLHYYFPTKPDLIKAVADTLTHAITTTPTPGVATDWQTLTAPAFLHEYVTNTAYQIRTTPQRFIVMCELFLHSRRDPAIAAILQQGTLWHTILIEPLTQGVASGQLRQDIDVAAIADVMITFSLGLPLLQGPHPEAVDRAILQFEQMLLPFVAPQPRP